MLNLHYKSRIFFNETLNKGEKIRLQKDSGNEADYLYQKACSTNAAAHDYLYNNILKKVSPEYKTVDYDWGNTIVPVK